MKKRDPQATTVWLPYVRVADAQAAADAARAAGGKVIREPTEVGVAIVAIIADPTGAPVGVAQLKGQEAQR
jgi:predicted enzyme related to lactoylglutathione lyase